MVCGTVVAMAWAAGKWMERGCGGGGVIDCIYVTVTVILDQLRASCCIRCACDVYS